MLMTYAANAGLRDQRKAMEWLHKYIGGFGGDPNNITVFGASTGGADIICHLLSSENETLPLFQRAVVQSAIVEPITPDISTAGWHLSRIMAALRISTIKDLRSIEAEKLVRAGMTFRAVDDGIFFRQGWQEYFGSGKEERPRAHKIETHMRAVTRSRSRNALRSISREARSRSRSTYSPSTPQQGNIQHQPLIIGDCSCDSLLWSLPASLWTSGAVVRRLRAVCQTLSKANNLLRAYDITPYTPDDEIVDRVLDLINDSRVAWPTECIAQLAKRDRGGQGVFRYVFDQESPSRGVPHHASDLMYLFDNVALDVCNNHSGGLDPFTVIEGSSPKISTTPTPTAAPTPQILLKSHVFPTPVDRGRHPRPRTLRGCPSDEMDFDEDLDIFFDSDSEDESISTPRSEDDFDWMRPVVDEWSYSRVRDAMQEKWIAFAHGEAPWKEDKVFVFGPEGEIGERSMSIFEGRRRKQLWQEALTPLGTSLVQKIGMELSRGPSATCGR